MVWSSSCSPLGVWIWASKQSKSSLSVCSCKNCHRPSCFNITLLFSWPALVTVASVIPSLVKRTTSPCSRDSSPNSAYQLGKITSVKPSGRTNDLFCRYREVLAVPNNFVRTALRGATVDKLEPVSLWAAVTQAYHYSVVKKRALSIVMSARMWWFIKLDGATLGVGKARKIEISEGSVVGSRNFLATVIKFLEYAKQYQTPQADVQREWQAALSVPPMGKRQADESADNQPNDTTEAQTSKRSGTSTQSMGSKRSRGPSNVKKASLSSTDQCYLSFIRSRIRFSFR